MLPPPPPLLLISLPLSAAAVAVLLLLLSVVCCSAAVLLLLLLLLLDVADAWDLVSESGDFPGLGKIHSNKNVVGLSLEEFFQLGSSLAIILHQGSLGGK